MDIREKVEAAISDIRERYAPLVITNKALANVVMKVLAEQDAVGEMKRIEIPSYTMNVEYAIDPEVYDCLPEGTKLYAAPVPNTPALWQYCPECGSPKTRYVEGRHKQCANCGQEWFADLDYSDVVQGNLHRLFAASRAPNVEAAHAMGAKGGPVVEAERLAFEAWMKGHCWAIGGTWNGVEYRSESELCGWLDPHTMQTRQLWAAWRDRAALCQKASDDV